MKQGPNPTMMNQLKDRVRQITDISAAVSVMKWDQAAYMPSGGAEARGRQVATLGQLSHDLFISDEMGALLEGLADDIKSLPVDHPDRRLVEYTQVNFDKSVRVPAEFMSRLYSNGAESFNAWRKARPADDFKAVQPYLERTVELSREYSSFFPEAEHVMDPLIDRADRDMKAGAMSALFKELRAELVPLVEGITAYPPAKNDFLKGNFPTDKQYDFGLMLAQRFGYDLNRGRLDHTHHPFCIRFSGGDVRILTNLKENDVMDGLFSTLHEAGHGLYEQGTDPALDGLPIASGVSAGVHESQSRLWENIVGRSRGFWGCFYPAFQATFPKQLGAVPMEDFYRAINRVERSIIRTESDEVTYNLHVIIRFDLEKALLEGDLQVKDLPGAWRERYQSDLGVSDPGDRDGVLQDVHWYDGVVGGLFQGYTLGNILSAQFYDAAVKARPSIPSDIARGECGTLKGWLTDNIYRHGSTFTPDELIERATGGPLTIKPYIAYLKGKYGDLYDLN